MEDQQNSSHNHYILWSRYSGPQHRGGSPVSQEEWLGLAMEVFTPAPIWKDRVSGGTK